MVVGRLDWLESPKPCRRRVRLARLDLEKRRKRAKDERGKSGEAGGLTEEMVRRWRDDHDLVVIDDRWWWTGRVREAWWTTLQAASCRVGGG